MTRLRLLTCVPARCIRGFAGATRRRGKTQPHFQPRPIVKHFDAGAVQAGDGSDNTQSEAASRRAAAAFEPVKALASLPATLHDPGIAKNS